MPDIPRQITKEDNEHLKIPKRLVCILCSKVCLSLAMRHTHAGICQRSQVQKAYAETHRPLRVPKCQLQEGISPQQGAQEASRDASAKIETLA